MNEQMTLDQIRDRIAEMTGYDYMDNSGYIPASLDFVSKVWPDESEDQDVHEMMRIKIEKEFPLTLWWHKNYYRLVRTLQNGEKQIFDEGSQRWWNGCKKMRYGYFPYHTKTEAKAAMAKAMSMSTEADQ